LHNLGADRIEPVQAEPPAVANEDGCDLLVERLQPVEPQHPARVRRQPRGLGERQLIDFESGFDAERLGFLLISCAVRRCGQILQLLAATWQPQ
jgi:hypothetical protein